MQHSLDSYPDRVSRLGWETASERPMAWRAPWRHFDGVLVLAVIALTAFGIAAIYASTFAGLRAQHLSGDTVAKRQLLNLGVGIAGLVLVASFDYRRYRRLAWVLLGVVVLALAAVPVVGARVNGAQSWFQVGPYQIQPSEYAKVGVIVVLAAILGGSRKDRGRPGLRQLALALAVVGLVSAEILLQPDFGTFMVFVAILFGTLLVGGVKARWLVVLVLIGSLGVVGMFKLDLLKQYQKERLTAFLDSSADPTGRGFTYNYRQSLTAVGSGGITGKGFLHGTQTNLQYVPEQRTDFIFTVIGEELGFAGGSLLLLIYLVMLWRGLRIAAIARDPFGSVLAAGVVSMFVFQSFINIGMTIGIMPITGIPLPFVSYGGSSLIASLLAVGLLLNVHMRRFRPQPPAA